MKVTCIFFTLFSFFLCFSFPVFAQKITISGNITNKANGEDLFGAAVVVKDMNNTGARTNAYGFYSLTIPIGKHTLIYRSSGFKDFEFQIQLDGDTVIDVELNKLKSIQKLEEVDITSKRGNENITSSHMNVTHLDPQKIKAIPIIFGEQDVMKTIQLTPGVKGGGEGTAGFYVRGGGADQNLILLDGSIVYNPSHLLGFFSVFNSDALKSVTLYKSGIPAKYGGRASSVLDIHMKDGNNKKFAATGGIGLISSRLTVEGPIVKNKGSFIISGRRSYADLFLALSKKELLRNTDLFFYDLNAKINYELNRKNRLYLSGYFGRDKFNFNDEFGISWGNKTGTLRWNHLINDKLFMNTTLLYGQFDYKFTISHNDQSFGMHSSIADYNIKQGYNYYLNSHNTIRFGFNGIYHTFQPGSLESSSEFGFEEKKLNNRHALELGVYLQNTQEIGDRWSLMYGIRYSGFDYMGKGIAYHFNEEGKVTDEKKYDTGETIKYYQGLEPRFSASFLLDENSSIKTSYNRIFQYIHKLSNTTTSSPTDIWVPSSNNVKPVIGDQVAFGYYRNFENNTYKLSGEIYYKWLQNVIDYKPMANLILNNKYENQLVYGKGRAFGVEIQLKKTKGKFTGWVNYTLSRSLRTFDAIDDGEEFPARQDRIHDVNLVLMYQINKRLIVSASFVFYTGDAVTFPSAIYNIDGYKVPFVGKRNSNRMPDYHRLDLGLTWYLKDHKHFEHSLSFSVYNVYNRKNAFSIRFSDHFKDNNTGQIQAVQTALFGIIPSITYNFKIK